GWRSLFIALHYPHVESIGIEQCGFSDLSWACCVWPPWSDVRQQSLGHTISLSALTELLMPASAIRTLISGF
ncbi:MAG: hypothetical protein AB7P20_25945, partial [Rhizobiaceae bacterium]